MDKWINTSRPRGKGNLQGNLNFSSKEKSDQILELLCWKSGSPPHPALQFRGELGLELAGGSFAVVSLDEHFVSQRCTVPQLLQIVELGGNQADRWANVLHSMCMQLSTSKAYWEGSVPQCSHSLPVCTNSG